jgi:hypothetical protein
VDGTGVPIPFSSQQTPEPARSGELIGPGKAFVQGRLPPVGRQRASSRRSRYQVAEPLGKRLRAGPWQNARPGGTSGRRARRAVARAEVLRLPMVPLRLHGYLARPGHYPFEPLAVGVGPDDIAVAAWPDLRTCCYKGGSKGWAAAVVDRLSTA